jgi:hypothetical protein
MTRAEVERILGVDTDPGGERPQGAEMWYDDEDGASIMVLFDENGRMRKKSRWSSPWPDERAPWEKIIDRIFGRKRERRVSSTTTLKLPLQVL